jgi:hypothetical protein
MKFSFIQKHRQPMTKNMHWLYLSLLVLDITACTAQNKPRQQPTLAEPRGEEIREFGLIMALEDAGYPFFNCTVSFTERQSEETFLINLEDPDMPDMGEFLSWKGRYAAFNYTSTLENSLLDLRQDGLSLLGVAATDLPEGLSRIVGTLSGATAITPGDLPGKIRIHDPESASLEFDCYITEEMVRVDGQLVEGWYEVRTRNQITAIMAVNK